VILKNINILKPTGACDANLRYNCAVERNNLWSETAETDAHFKSSRNKGIGKFKKIDF
jgi:hypothetical protein